MDENKFPNITPEVLDGYLGKSISAICGNGLCDSNLNHCAHFVNHVLGLDFSYSCRDQVGGNKPAANIRVQETFARCGQVGIWPPPNATVKCYAFVTETAAVDLNRKTMRNVPNKHVGIYCQDHVWHYSNSQDKVVKVIPSAFEKHFAGPGYTMYFGEFPAAERRWPTEFVTQVAWGDMDAFQHVNNTVFLRWFENARVQWLENVNFPEEQGKHGPVLASASINFRGSVKHPDRIAVRVRAKDMGRASVTLEYEVVSQQEEQVVADGETRVSLVDFVKGNSKPLDEATRKRIIDQDSGVKARTIR